MRKIDGVLSIIEKTKEELQLITGFNMNYHPSSLKKMEKIIVEGFPGNSMGDTTLAMLGIYLGETIRRNVKNAEWVDYDKFVNEAHIQITVGEGKMEADPFVRIERFMKDNDYGIYAFYAMCKDMGSEKITMTEASKTTTETNKGVYTLKTLTVPEEVSKKYKNGEITKEELYKHAKKTEE